MGGRGGGGGSGDMVGWGGDLWLSRWWGGSGGDTHTGTSTISISISILYLLLVWESKVQKRIGEKMPNILYD